MPCEGRWKEVVGLGKEGEGRCVAHRSTLQMSRSGSCCSSVRRIGAAVESQPLSVIDSKRGRCFVEIVASHRSIIVLSPARDYARDNSSILIICGHPTPGQGDFLFQQSNLLLLSWRERVQPMGNHAEISTDSPLPAI
jgi:hypothetical protein